MSILQTTMKNYIKQRKSKENYFIVNGIEVYQNSALPDNVSVRSVVEKSTSIVPKKLYKFIEKIKIGEFDVLDDRDLNALYKDKTIYLTNIQDSEEDMLDDIIHEMAHSVEEVYAHLIYSDGKIKEEFRIKREKLKKILDSTGHHIDPSKYASLSYDREFDMFLYKDVGYEKLSSLTSGIFLSPYAATSLREYFANGFENIFLSNESYQIIRKTCPRLFEKLIELITIEETGEKINV